MGGDTAHSHCPTPAQTTAFLSRPIRRHTQGEKSVFQINRLRDGGWEGMSEWMYTMQWALWHCALGVPAQSGLPFWK